MSARMVVKRSACSAVLAAACASMALAACSRAPASGKVGDTAVQLFYVRFGRLIGRETFVLEGIEVSEAGENQVGALIGAFVQQFYDKAPQFGSLALDKATFDWLVRAGDVDIRLLTLAFGV